MSLKFSQIQPLVSMVTDRVIMGKRCLHFFSAFFHPFLFILAGNDNMHESSEEFEFQPEKTMSPIFIPPPPPPQTVFAGGYTVFTLSIRPSDCLSVTLCFLNNLKNH